jgi:hypothetical protein
MRRPFALGLDIIAAADHHGGQHAAEEILAEIAGPSAQGLFVHGEQFAFGHCHLDIVIVLRRPQSHLTESGAQRPQHGKGLLQRRVHFGCNCAIIRVQMAHDSDAQTFDVAGQRRAIIRHRAICAGRVVRVVPGDRLQHDRAVLDGPGHRAGVVEAERIRVDAIAAHQTVGRLQPDNAAERSGATDRTTGIGAERRRDKPRRHRRTRAARGAAGEVLAVPRVAGRRPGQVE